MNIALITGASSGLGRGIRPPGQPGPPRSGGLGRRRREDRLRQLASLCACPVRPVPWT